MFPIIVRRYATTPLTLSLLIQLFKSKQLKSQAEQQGSKRPVMNRGALYEARFASRSSTRILG